MSELQKAFKDSVDDYLAFCAEREEKPEKPYSGQFVTRISPDLHRNITAAASISGQSLNSWVTDQLKQAVKVTLSNAKPRVRKRPQRTRIMTLDQVEEEVIELTCSFPLDCPGLHFTSIPLGQMIIIR
ncbi:MAG TPA: type II toxin-antitoxin system HicB family antitoxin [Gemmataceae bacterium]|nr:type II toxin-antitoxin system HicB family antitoxin [Gemmataceae bacterium]